jgi:hypothetical protein
MASPQPIGRLTQHPMQIVWWISLAVAFAAIVWLFLDSLAAHAVALYTGQAATWAPGGVLNPSFARMLAVKACAATAIVSLITVAATLLIGPPSQRGVRSWLGLMTLLAAWFTLAFAWQDIAWAGSCWRISDTIVHIEPIARQLNDAWPCEDGAVPGLGQFSAYPVGRPRTLLIIADDPIAVRPSIAAVERSPQGALRFQLAGKETGAWLEWHPAGSEPATFTGGLEDSQQLERSSQLAPQWFAVRYAPAYACIEQPSVDALTPAE